MLKTVILCSSCRGTGSRLVNMSTLEPCDRCNGSGRMIELTNTLPFDLELIYKQAEQPAITTCCEQPDDEI